MEPEVIVNLWLFVDKGTRMIYELAVRPYMMAGSDADKFKLLTALAPSDFHFAPRFKLPDRYTVEFEGSQRKGLTFAGGVGPVYEGVDPFLEAFDAIEKQMPARRIGLDGMQSGKAPFDKNNLLNVKTFVEVDENGNQIAKITDRPVPTQTPAAVANLWTFHDERTKGVYALAGRAYMVCGTDADKREILRTLAANDYGMVHAVPVVDDCSMTINGAVRKGVIDPTAAKAKGNALFLAVFQAIERDIPAVALGIHGTKETRASFSSERLISLTTCIVEGGKDGTRTITGQDKDSIEVSPPQPAPAKGNYSDDDFQGFIKVLTKVQKFLVAQPGEDWGLKLVAGMDYAEPLWEAWRKSLGHAPQLAGASFAGLPLSLTDFSGADLRGANLNRTIGTRLDFKGADLGMANLRDCKWALIKLNQTSSVRGADFTGSRILIDVFGDWSGAILRGVELELHDADQRACLKDVDFTGCKLRVNRDAVSGTMDRFRSLLSLEQKKQLEIAVPVFCTRCQRPLTFVEWTCPGCGNTPRKPFSIGFVVSAVFLFAGISFTRFNPAPRVLMVGVGLGVLILTLIKLVQAFKATPQKQPAVPLALLICPPPEPLPSQVTPVPPAQATPPTPLPPEPESAAQSESKTSQAPPPELALSITFECSGCKKKLKIKVELAGKRVKCPGCGQVVLTPAPQPAVGSLAEKDKWVVPGKVEARAFKSAEQSAFESLDHDLARTTVLPLVAIVTLRQSDQWAIKRALQALVSLAPRQVVPLLISTVHSNQFNAEASQIYSACTLGDIRDPRAVDALMDALDYDHICIRFAAAKALAQIARLKGADALPPPPNSWGAEMKPHEPEFYRLLNEARDFFRATYRKADWSNGQRFAADAQDLSPNQALLLAEACRGFDTRRVVVTLKDTLLNRQVKSAIEHIRHKRISESDSDWVCTVRDFPAYNVDYLADLEARIKWGPEPVAEDRKQRILLATAEDRLLTALREMRFFKKVGDKAMLAGFLLYPQLRDCTIVLESPAEQKTPATTAPS